MDLVSFLKFKLLHFYAIIFLHVVYLAYACFEPCCLYQCFSSPISKFLSPFQDETERQQQLRERARRLISEARQGVISPNGSSSRSGTPQSSTPSLSPVKSKTNSVFDITKDVCDNKVRLNDIK